jgi:hypothetical protein
MLIFKVMRLLFFILAALSFVHLNAQEEFYDEKTRHTIDSLDNRIAFLEGQIPKLSNNRDAKYFSTKRDLDMTNFVRSYELFLFEEDLEAAGQLIDSRIKASEKRMDQFAVDFYKGYNLELTKVRGRQQAHYQELFEKEKNFKKEWQVYIDVGDEYSLNRALRMVDLAIKYASEKNLQETLIYLKKYKRFTEMLIFDVNSPFDLKKLTSNESVFMNTFGPMIDSDSLETIKKGMRLVEACYNYSAGVNAVVDTVFLAKKKTAADNAIADWNSKQGISEDLAKLTGRAFTAQLDSINHEGIYSWKNKIVVIGSMNFSSKAENVRRGEAIMDADRRVINYIRLNKYANVSNSVKIGNTVMLPFILNGNTAYFIFDKTTNKWQYMICYSMVVNEQVTKLMLKSLYPMQFQEEIKTSEIQ